MSRVTRFMIVLISSLLLLSAMIAVAARRAQAQEDQSAESEPWQPYSAPTNVASQPDKRVPPPNVAGCWSGDVEDDHYGSGTGFAFIVQKGTTLKKGTMIGIDLVDGPGGQHGIRGTVSRKGMLKLHLQQFSCVVNVRGKVMTDEVVGTYSLNKACRVGGKLVGTFDFTFDPSGTSCP